MTGTSDAPRLRLPLTPVGRANATLSGCASANGADILVGGKRGVGMDRTSAPSSVSGQPPALSTWPIGAVSGQRRRSRHATIVASARSGAMTIRYGRAKSHPRAKLTGAITRASTAPRRLPCQSHRPMRTSTIETPMRSHARARQAASGDRSRSQGTGRQGAASRRGSSATRPALGGTGGRPGWRRPSRCPARRRSPQGPVSCAAPQ